MPTCRAGHDSATSDYCDVCGAPITGSSATTGESATAASGQDPAGAGPAEACPDCGFPRTGRFCEGCGYDFVAGSPGMASEPVSTTAASPPAASTPAAGTASTASAAGTAAASGWTAIVAADRDYFDLVVAAGGPDAGQMTFPPYCPERSFPLTGDQVRVGRRSVSRGLEPEIDLTGPPLDPGVSHLHVLLVRGADGGWQAVDPGSANGTLINDGADPIETNVPVAVADGDQIHIGAWTTITLRNGGV
jgi:hypothetical protein